MVIKNELYDFVTQPEPMDLSSVRDPGMKCLIHLAVSLHWSVHQKHNQPVVITAKDGMQKRLPTTTSIRMSVFQTALSSIIVHTDEMTVPTIELIDAIIAIHKPSTDHARRLRLAVGETPAQHRDRVASAEAEVKGAREPQPLTTRLQISGDVEGLIDQMLDEHFRQVLEDEPAAHAATEEGQMTYIAADAGDHGEVVSREPYQAIKASTNLTTTRYISDTSYERRWADDYIDYECMACGKAFASSKGVGSHSQVHGPADERKAWKRAEMMVKSPRVETELVWEEPPSEEAATQVATEPVVVSVLTQPTYVPGDEQRDILRQITELVAPDLIAKIEALEAENQALKDRLDEVEGEFDAFIDLAQSRRKKT